MTFLSFREPKIVIGKEEREDTDNKITKTLKDKFSKLVSQLLFGNTRR